MDSKCLVRTEEMAPTVSYGSYKQLMELETLPVEGKQRVALQLIAIYNNRLSNGIYYPLVSYQAIKWDSSGCMLDLAPSEECKCNDDIYCPPELHMCNTLINIEKVYVYYLSIVILRLYSTIPEATFRDIYTNLPHIVTKEYGGDWIKACIKKHEMICDAIHAKGPLFDWCLIPQAEHRNTLADMYTNIQQHHPDLLEGYWGESICLHDVWVRIYKRRIRRTPSVAAVLKEVQTFAKLFPECDVLHLQRLQEREMGDSYVITMEISKPKDCLEEVLAAEVAEQDYHETITTWLNDIGLQLSALIAAGYYCNISTKSIWLDEDNKARIMPVASCGDDLFIVQRFGTPIQPSHFYESLLCFLPERYNTSGCTLEYKEDMVTHHFGILGYQLLTRTSMKKLTNAYKGMRKGDECTTQIIKELTEKYGHSSMESKNLENLPDLIIACLCERQPLKKALSQLEAVDSIHIVQLAFHCIASQRSKDNYVSAIGFVQTGLLVVDPIIGSYNE